MTDETSPELPGAVLFACNFNRVRSPMAEALLKRVVGDRVYVDSCGLKHQRPGGEPDAMSGVDPFVQAVLDEIGCEIPAHRPKTFEELEDESFDLIVSLTPEAQDRAAEMARGRAAIVEYWPIPDPTLSEGSREARLAAYRQARDSLAARIARRFGS